MPKKSKVKNKHKVDNKLIDKSSEKTINMSDNLLNDKCNNDKASEKSILKHLSRKIDAMSLKMEKMKFVDYVYFIEHPKKMLWANFTNGIARGFGIAIGFTILSAVTLYILKFIVTINLPYIGKYISEIVEIVQNSMKNPR